MKSSTSFKGHPIHPILVAFPIALFTCTLLADVAGLIMPSDILLQTGLILNAGGIVFALIAAIPGFIDYLFTVPPASSAKTRAAKHGLINITVVILFSISLALKFRIASPAIIIGVELAGFILLCIAGFMGGTLVYRNQIGVYNRYANKGIWKEERVTEKNNRLLVGTTDELKTDQLKLIHVHGQRIVVGKTDDGYVAFDDHCTHKGGSLAGGVMICGTVQCPWHGSQFDTRTGAVKAGPATERIKTYTVTVEQGKLYISLL
jgi:nitrite reductase/ring-hydroxylating ferredoxin subunit/uncharacterized membrane protein